MNNVEMEKKLLESGFSGKDIAILKRYIEKDQTSYQLLLSELKKRFIACCVLLLVLACFWLKTFLTGNQEDIEAFTFALVIGALVLYFMAPMRLSGKAFFFLRKNRHLS